MEMYSAPNPIWIHGHHGVASTNAVNRKSTGTGNHQRPLPNGLEESHHWLRRLVVH